MKRMHKSSKLKRSIRRPALRIEQNKKQSLYLFSLTGDEILSIAEISRLSRNDAGKLIGYQRADVKRHIQDIVEYLNSDDILFPNSLILALTPKVRFTTNRSLSWDSIQTGILEIPFSRNGKKPAWIVDGQQRALAISKSVRKDLPIPINAFIAKDIELQRDQFLRVNNTRPLPRGLITELLPEVSAPLPATFQQKKLPSAICEMLNSEPRSPFYKLISRASTSEAAKRNAIIADTSIIKMLQESLSNPSGCLFPYHNLATGKSDFDAMWATLVSYWIAVKNTFPDAWGKPPSRSRLMHGAGIRAMGKVMDKVMGSIHPNGHDTVALVQRELQSIAPVCRWTEGRWRELGDLNWNEVQNVPRHIRMLSNVLVRTYVQARGNGQ